MSKSSVAQAMTLAKTLAGSFDMTAPGRRPFPIGTAFELLTALSFFSRPFDRRKPVWAMNG
ncbi:hypothetical protein [Bradyrhizobium cosmicum]|uniref:hypothetical protein n=1 Tax=Bradyrhizobium cosmicum TaxID=1404864 RepID=UPI001F0B2C7D|nr:hypothetical protein [Bradyrhizobium cosmicum]